MGAAQDEAITAEQALRACTINAAYAAGRGAEEGSLEVGKPGNFAVLDIDPLECSAVDIRSMKVIRPYVDGRLVYEARKTGPAELPG